MAGRVKHMERSHRSHSNNAAVFTAFQRDAYTAQYIRNSRKEGMSIGQLLSSAIRKILPSRGEA